MHPTTLLALAALLLTLRTLYTRLHHALTARSLACHPPPAYPGDILGINSFKESVQAARKHTLPRLFQQRMARMSDREHRLVESYAIRQLGRDVFFTCDPKNIQALIATQFKDFGLGKVRQVTLEPLLGRGIFTTDGQEWSHSRALLRPQFTRDQISDLALEERHVQTALLAIPTNPTTHWSGPVNIQTIFFRLTMDSATEFLFGESVDSQAAALDPTRASADAEFATLFDRGQWYAAQRTRLEMLHWAGHNRESREATAFVRGYVDRFVKAALKSGSRGASGDVEEKGHGQGQGDEKEGYVFLKGLASATQDPVELRSQLLNILLAGRDTTASLLSWSVMMLARHPRVFTKLRSVVLDTFGPYTPTDSGSGGTQTITFASLKACRYLQHFLNEVLRLYPIVPVNRRMALTDTSLPRGGGPDGTQPVYIRKGQRVFYSVFVMQRRKDLWGDDAEEFVPERWETRKPGWEYLPFNGGPRICIGQQFALTEAGYVLVRLLQRFDAVEGVSVGTKPGDVEEREIGLQNHLTMAPAEQVTVRLREAC